MRTFSKILLLSAFSCACIAARPLASIEQKNPPMLTFTDLKTCSHHQGQMVAIRGFIYQKEGGDWILAEEPNLKTCCVGTVKKIDRQIFVSGELDNPGTVTAVTLQGRFDAKPKRDSEGNIKSFYHITEATLLVEPNRSWCRLFFVLVIAFGVFYLLFLMLTGTYPISSFITAQAVDFRRYVLSRDLE